MKGTPGVVPAGGRDPPGEGQCLHPLTSAPVAAALGAGTERDLVRFSGTTTLGNEVQKTRARGCPEAKVPPTLLLHFEKPLSSHPAPQDVLKPSPRTLTPTTQGQQSTAVTFPNIHSQDS